MQGNEQRKSEEVIIFKKKEGPLWFFGITPSTGLITPQRLSSHIGYCSQITFTSYKTRVLAGMLKCYDVQAARAIRKLTYLT